MSAYEISILSAIGINVILAVSLNMISGFCGQISLGHGAFYGAGAYAAALVMVNSGNAVFALGAAVLAGCLLGILVGFTSLRVRSDFLAITTIGVNFLFTGFVRKQEWLGGEMGIGGIPPTGLGAKGNMIMILLFALATVAFSFYVGRSWMGFAFRAVGEDESAAATLGINSRSYKMAAFGIGTALAGLAGGLYTFFTQFITADNFDFLLSVMIMVMVVIGGIGSTWGVVVAAVALTLLPEVIRFVNDYRLLIFGGTPCLGYPRRSRRSSLVRSPLLRTVWPPMSATLQLEDVAMRFGGIRAVAGVSFAIAAGDFVGIIGPNGAGKTTLMRIIAGLFRPDRGRVFLEGIDVTSEATSARVRRGLALTHQIVRPFREMTVLDNVVLAAGINYTQNPFRALMHLDRQRELERAENILHQVGLGGTERKPAGTLPLGQMKRLEVARALAVDPKVILLDEPLAGLNYTEASKQVETIADINRRGVTVVLIEHNLEEVLRICRRLIVLNDGKLIGDGKPAEVMSDPVVHDAYVGGGAETYAEA